MRTVRGAVPRAAVAAGVLATSLACSGPHGTAHGAPPAAPPGTSAAGTSAATSRTLTGRDLATALLTRGEAHTAGYTVLSPEPSVETPMTERNEATPARCAPVLDAMEGGRGAGYSALASESVTADAHREAERFLLLAAFPGDGAARFMTRLRTAVTSCGSFSYPGRYGGSVAARVTRTTVTASGADESVSFLVTTTSSPGGMTGEDDWAVTVVRCGGVTGTATADRGFNRRLTPRQREQVMPTVDPGVVGRQTAKLRRTMGG
ncbi:MAG TPA: hypothetical protein VGL02_29440 [Streptomyces sp.]